MKKTIIICAQYRSEWKRIKNTTKSKNKHKKLIVDYSNVTVFGETSESNGITLVISNHLFQNTSYEKLIKYCTEWYCKYFNVDEYNITYMEYLVNLNTTLN